jgi:pimeloyl-ACP methyl ester carboxylesterase
MEQMTGPSRSGQMLKVNDLCIYYEEYGSGKPLVLIHGGASTHSMWEPVIPLLSQHFRVIIPDSRGHGKTNNPQGELSYRLMATDVVGFVRTLGLAKPLICGYSDGGQIALEIGMGYPGLASALVIGAAWYRMTDTYQDFLRQFGFERPGEVNFEYVEKTFPELLEVLKAEHMGSGDPGYWKTLLKQISLMFWTPLDYSAADFQKITDPALILMGDRDGTIEVEQAVEMYRLIPHAELAILPNTSHMTALQSKYFSEVVLDFLLRQTHPPQ